MARGPWPRSGVRTRLPVVWKRPVGGFDPRSISGLVSWWDASDSSTVTLNGGRVSEFRNKVSGAPAMSQPTAANQPLYVSSGRNSKNVIDLDSTVRWLDNTTAQSIGFYAVALSPSGTQSFGTIFSFVGKHGLIRNGTGANSYFSANSMFPEASQRRNGATSIVLGTDWAVFSQGGTVDTRALQLSLDGVGGVRATGQFGEVVVYSRNLSASERQRVERYLGLKWGITVA